MKKYKLGDIATVEISGVDKKVTDGEKEIRLCNFVDVYYNWAITIAQHDSFMLATARSNEISKFQLKKGQVALTKDSETRYDIGIPTYIADDFEDVILGYHCALISPNKDILDGRYLNALLHTDYAKKYFACNASGSGQRYALSVEALNSFPVPIIPLHEQEQIGEIFSALDKKIELNRQINQNLEAMAKQLYDYWFVQFDFPNEEGKPYKSSGGKMVWNEKLKREIPKGWEDCKLVDFITLFDFKRIPLSSNERAAKKGSYPYYGATGIMDYVDDYIFDGDYLLLAEDGSTSDINGFPIVQYIWGKNWVNNHAHIILPQNVELIIYAYLLLKRIPAKMIETGSIQKKISQENLLAYKIDRPPLNLMKLYCMHVSPLWEQWKLNIEKIATLTKQRDELLPLLMNGQVSVNSDLSHN